MSRHRMFIVDVFAEARYAGNQLAVITDAGDLSDTTMQALARETHFSETTFILAPGKRRGGFDVRIFTPAAEVPFAGHPTLGTAWVIRRELLGGVGDEVVLNLQVGPIPVTFQGEGGSELLWMRQNPPRAGRQVAAAEVAPAVGLEAGDLDGELPVEEVSTGLPFLIVPLRNLQALRRSRLERERCRALVAGLEAKALLLFTREGREPGHDLAVRVYADHYGVPEDPATGSANGCLAGYLVRHRVLGGDEVDVRAGQGHEVGRPSVLYLKARRDGEEIAVSVGGRVVPTFRGELE